MQLEGKIAVITGGARGIGRAICERYAAEGALAVVADRLGSEAEGTAATIMASGGNALAVEVDVTEHASINAMVETVVSQTGGIDILVNGAGIFDMEPILEVTSESYDRVFAVNVKGLLFTLQAVARQMVAQGRGGKIINFSSQAGRTGERLVAVYCASKAAVISLTQSAAMGLIQHKINVNAIAPGVIDTPMWDRVDALFAKYQGLPIGQRKREVGEAVPYGRMGQPDDMVGAAVFLASKDSDYILGQTLNVDGGNRLN